MPDAQTAAGGRRRPDWATLFLLILGLIHSVYQPQDVAVQWALRIALGVFAVACLWRVICSFRGER